MHPLTRPRPAVLLATAAVLWALGILAVPPLGLGLGGRGRQVSSSPSSPHGQQHLRCERSSFASLLPAGATLEQVTSVRDGGSFGEGAANVGYPTNPTGLPALCAVTVRVKSSATSSYRFGLFLPGEWNGRFLVVGNGGFAGGVNWLDMAAGPRNGMASLSTDTGHSATATQTSWALNQPEKRTDWGWRAVHGSTVLGKQLVRAYYAGQPLAYSYYSGCSTGGRQGLKELQLYPDSFDGALVGAPAWWTSHLNNYVAQIGIYNLPVTDPKHLAPADVALLAAEVLRQCDGVDGVRDGIVSTPYRCNLDLTRIQCPSNTPSPSKCLTPAQISTAHNIYNTRYLAADGSIIHPGLTTGSEAQWWILINGTSPTPYGLGYARDFLYDDPTWDWQRSFSDAIYAYADKTNPGGATADDYAALGKVRARGGKVMLYHGLADGLVPTQGTELYYNRTVAALGGGSVDDFMRLFLIPGMQHCWGTAVDAPWDIAGAFQAGVMGAGTWSVPGFEDAGHDALLALVDWVEKGRAVESVVATTWRSSQDPTSGVRRQRPVCKWPRTAVWDGQGDVDEAGSWRCEG